jgi:two-component system, NarL family, response regulator NreC
MERPYSIVLADSHARFRQGIKKSIEENSELKVITEVGDGLELLDYLNKNAIPDMVILTISMPRMVGIEATVEIKKNYPEIKVLVLTIHDGKEYLNRALAAGANGYLLKDEADSELISAISTIRHGEIYICPRMRSIGS